MSVKKMTAGVTEKEVETIEKEQAVKRETKYSLEKLRQNSIALFGVTQSTFDGAMYGNENREFSVKEAKGIIDVWLYGEGGKK